MKRKTERCKTDRYFQRFPRLAGKFRGIGHLEFLPPWVAMFLSGNPPYGTKQISRFCHVWAPGERAPQHTHLVDASHVRFRCTYTRMHAGRHTRTHPLTHTHAHTLKNAQTHTHMHTRTLTHVCMHTQTLTKVMRNPILTPLRRW